MNPSFTDDEILELAEVFPAGPSATTLLSAAGFPERYLPSPFGLNSMDFWAMVDKSVRSGIMTDGRRTILRKAAERYPENRIFAQTRIRRILVVGAAPDGYDSIKVERDVRAALDACAGRGIDVAYRPAARLGDLDAIVRTSPHLLHLACHGDGQHLVFDGDGGPDPVPVTDVVDLLQAYAEHTGMRLRGIYLASCHSEQVARMFQGLADRVVALAGPALDRCSVAFAEHFYRQIAQDHEVAVAARLAARTLAKAQPWCADLARQLVVLDAR